MNNEKGLRQVGLILNILGLIMVFSIVLDKYFYS